MQNPADPERMPRVLVSGTSSGLGKALRRAFDAEPVVRATLDADLSRLTRSAFDIVVHCAADARKDFPAAELPAYRESNLTLAERLLDVPHRLFVFISSQAVYPADGHAWRENEQLQVSDALSVYGVFKLLAEDVVLHRAARALILRTAALVGPEGRTNNIMRILRREAGRIFLDEACPYNLIAYSQVARFIRESYEAERSGTFNLGARDARSLGDIARHLGAAIAFGDHLYTAPTADLSKVRTATRIFDLTTLDVADLVVGEIDAARPANDA